MKLDMVQTLAFAGVMLFLGYAVQRRVTVLAKYNIPAPVIGGLLVAVALLFARDDQGAALVQFDTTLREPLMIGFFTSIGFAASLRLLRVGGLQVVIFLGIATVVAVAQNLVGGALAWLLGQPPLLGVLAGSVTLTGGPATGMAFAPAFEAAGVSGAGAVAIGAATAGIVLAGVFGGPIGTFLITRRGLQPAASAAATPGGTAHNVIEGVIPEPETKAPVNEDQEAYQLSKTLVVMLVAMGLGAAVSAKLNVSFTLPAYIGAMLVAAVIKNLDELTGSIGLSARQVDDLGNVALSLFLVMALMTLDLAKLASLAAPLLVMLAAQVLVAIVTSATVVFLSMGRDYQAAVIAAGFYGFMMGTTASAMASMRVLAERYGPAPRAFLVVPIVGAFFIDFTNALVITGFLNLWK